MADYKPPTIVREEIHLVKNWTVDNYGNTIVTTADSEPIKIAAKRSGLAEKLVADTQFKFKYANYMNKDYVADIECMESAETVAEKPTLKAYSQPPPPPATREHSIETQVCIKEIGEAIRAGIEVNAGLKTAYWAWIMARLDVEEVKGKEVSTPKVEAPTKEMLKALMDAAIWDASQVATYINDKYGVKITSTSKMFESLSNEQKKAVLEHIDKNPKILVEDLPF